MRRIALLLIALALGLATPAAVPADPGWGADCPFLDDQPTECLTTPTP